MSLIGTLRRWDTVGFTSLFANKDCYRWFIVMCWWNRDSHELGWGDSLFQRGDRFKATRFDCRPLVMITGDFACWSIICWRSTKSKVCFFCGCGEMHPLSIRWSCSCRHFIFHSIRLGNGWCNIIGIGIWRAHQAFFPSEVLSVELGSVALCFLATACCLWVVKLVHLEWSVTSWLLSTLIPLSRKSGDVDWFN